MHFYGPRFGRRYYGPGGVWIGIIAAIVLVIWLIVYAIRKPKKDDTKNDSSYTPGSGNGYSGGNNYSKY